MKMNDDNKTVAAVDCLVPGIGEIIGGSQREDDYDKLVARMKELGLKEEDYGFYLDLRKYGSTRHAGFGLGFERCIMYLTGMSNIRDVIPFPRTVNNCELSKKKNEEKGDRGTASKRVCFPVCCFIRKSFYIRKGKVKYEYFSCR